jgi:hypothetical protein
MQPLFIDIGVPVIYHIIEGDPRLVLASSITQFVRTTAGGVDFMRAWTDLKNAIDFATCGRTQLCRAVGLHENEMASLIFIGWESWEAYRIVGKNRRTQAQIHALGGELAVTDALAALSAITK